ncbi:MAG: nucleotide exchange factor GrpE [Dehalococcoidia bacterium]|nr:nucleotide exchange factor GrpE [Dehalococcoidia bacterium]
MLFEDLPVAEQNDDSEQSNKSFEELRQKAADYLASWQRCQADFVNYKRRAEQEKEEAGRLANSGLLLAILPVFDDLERAFAAMPAKLQGDRWADGMKMILRKMQSTLETQGLTSIPCVGEEFDPVFHEALRRCEGKEGVVIEEMEKGYKYRDKLLRPSKVAVGEGEQNKEE